MNFATISAVYTALEHSKRPKTTKELSKAVFGDTTHYGTIAHYCTLGCDWGSIQRKRDLKLDRMVYSIKPCDQHQNHFANISAIYTALEESDHPMTTRELSKVVFGSEDDEWLKYVARWCKWSAYRSMREAGGVANLGVIYKYGHLVNQWGVRRMGEAPIQPDTSLYPEMARISPAELEDLMGWFDNHSISFHGVQEVIRILERAHRLMTSKEIATVIGDTSKKGVNQVVMDCMYLAEWGYIDSAGRDPKTNVLIWCEEAVPE